MTLAVVVRTHNQGHRARRIKRICAHSSGPPADCSMQLAIRSLAVCRCFRNPPYDPQIQRIVISSAASMFSSNSPESYVNRNPVVGLDFDQITALDLAASIPISRAAVSITRSTQ